jgi:hypothetical protein
MQWIKRCLQKSTILLFAYATIALPAAANAEMPSYDAKAWCQQVAAAGGSFSELIYGGCLQQEQTEYNALKPNWDGLPAKVRGWCDQVARAGGQGSFVILKGCVEQELGAARSNRTFEFQR